MWLCCFLSLYFISPVSISVGRRRSPPPPAVLIAGGHPRRPSPSPFAVLARRPRRKLEPRRGLLQPVPRRAAIMDGEHGDGELRGRRRSRCRHGGGIAEPAARPHATTVNQNASNQDGKSFNQIHQKLQAVIGMAECYNRRHKMLQPLMKKLQPETIEKALTKAATKKKAATI